MECHLVINASPLFLVSSKDEEKTCLHVDHKAHINPDIQGFCSSDILDHSTVFPQQVQFPAETSFLTPSWVEIGGGFNRPLKSNRNNCTKQESTRILDMIKYSPKFLRKKKARQPCKHVSPSTVEEINDVLQGELNQKLETNPGSVSPKTGFRKKLPLSVHPNDTAVLEYKSAGPAVATENKSGISDQETSELGSSKGRKNWRKVKAALKRMNDSGEDFKPELASSDENTQGDGKLRIKLPSVEMSMQDDDENEEDIYQRLKAFLNHSEKKLKTQWSPRLQPFRNKFGFWPPKGTEAAVVPYPATPATNEQNFSSSPLSSNQFPVLKSKLYPVGRRRCSAPEPVLRREAVAFSFKKKAKDKEETLNTQTKSMKYKKDHGVQNPYRKQEVQERIRFVMEKSLKNLTAYCPETCGQLNATISEEIAQYVQSTDVVSEDEQKKIVCLVYIGAVKDDGIHAAVRCMWIPGEDHLVVSDYQNHSLYALAVVFTASC